MIDSKLLHGWSYEAAKCMGMPHFGAHYLGGDYRRYSRDPYAECMVCGRPATDVHHQPFRDYFQLRTKWGIWSLMPGLVTLCRECHEKVEHSEIRIRWDWCDEETEGLWWSGYLQCHGFPPHSPRLNELGAWVYEQI